MLTYCIPSSGAVITAELLKAHGIVADECHSTHCRVMGYTYLHLTKKTRQTRIEAFFRGARETHGFVSSDVVGYDAIASDSRAGEKEDGDAVGKRFRGDSVLSSSLQKHVVFQMLVRDGKDGRSCFQPWTDGKPVLSRGPLFDAIQSHMVAQAAEARRAEDALLLRVVHLGQRLEETEQAERFLRETLASSARLSAHRIRLLEDENAELRRKLRGAHGH
jgi:hypothetical protein